jgi:hypothetical protein
METLTNIQGVLINTGHLLAMGRIEFVNRYKDYIYNCGAEYDKLKIETIDNAGFDRPLPASKKFKRK